MRDIYWRAAALLCIASASIPAQAEVSGNVTLVSNYLSYGLSQTEDAPALQLSATWSGESGIYASGWASQVDFGEGTNTELGIYAGYYSAFSDAVSLDWGIAQFLYEGADNSDDYNYNEVYATLATAFINIGLHYAWDYFGSDADYTVVQASKQFSLQHGFTLTLGADYSVTGDKSKYSILGESDCLHYFVRAEKEWRGLQWRLSLHDTTMSTAETDKARVVAGVGWAF